MQRYKAEVIRYIMAEVNIIPQEYLDKIPAEQWNNLCDYFNSLVSYSYYYKFISPFRLDMPQEVHYFRNKLNRYSESFQDIVDNSSNWQLYNKKDTRYHMNNGDFESTNLKYPFYSSYNNEYNLKFVTKDGLFESIVSPKISLENLSNDEIIELLKNPDNWVILTDMNSDNPNHRYDPVNMGTYNYFASLAGNPFDDAKHRVLDVETFFSYGNVSGLFYGNSKTSRNENGEFARKSTLTDMIFDYYEGIFL
ncbi:MAG: hypothetical protein LBM93_03390 [Oscillospiraceae bacterium]|jgi:hypothetical protein|nr:hypothetical protein [Oscillospiraceae bacterium]